MDINYLSVENRGIDISQFNGFIDWQKITSITHHFCIPRAGFGKVTDTKFDANWEALKKTAIMRAIYWYIDYYSNHIKGSGVDGMTDAEWGAMQAEACWAKIKDDPCFVWADVENGNPAYAKPLTDASTKKGALIITRAFLERLDQLSGNFNGIYTSVGWLNWFSAWFKDRPLWVAWYNEYQTATTVRAACQAAGWNSVYIWQFSSQKVIAGAGQCDTNAFIGTVADFGNLFGGALVVVTPEDETPVEDPVDEPAKTELIEYVVDTSRLNIRALPTTNSSILGMLYSGTPVKCSKEVNLGIGSVQGWVQVDGQEQYLSLDLLKK